MTDHWQTIEDALKDSYYATWRQAGDDENKAATLARKKAALAFVREMRQGVQPDWLTAPEWANWWAVDVNGAAFWHENKPQQHRNNGWLAGGKFLQAHDPGANWRETLRQRPQPKEGAA